MLLKTPILPLTLEIPRISGPLSQEPGTDVKYIFLILPHPPARFMQYWDVDCLSAPVRIKLLKQQVTFASFVTAFIRYPEQCLMYHRHLINAYQMNYLIQLNIH